MWISQGAEAGKMYGDEAAASHRSVGPIHTEHRLCLLPSSPMVRTSRSDGGWDGMRPVAESSANVVGLGFS